MPKVCIEMNGNGKSPVKKAKRRMKKKAKTPTSGYGYKPPAWNKY
jgi:hypothetical protein